MAFYRGSSSSLLQHTRILPVSGSVKQSRALCGSTRDFSKFRRVPASRIREVQATRGHGIVVSAISSTEPPVQKELDESPPRPQHPLPASSSAQGFPSPDGHHHISRLALQQLLADPSGSQSSHRMAGAVLQREISPVDHAETIKAKIMSHPQYSALVAAYLDCQKVRTQEAMHRSSLILSGDVSNKVICHWFVDRS